eukprot:2600147-Pyramimonas_sp.AAC.1
MRRKVQPGQEGLNSSSLDSFPHCDRHQPVCASHTGNVAAIHLSVVTNLLGPKHVLALELAVEQLTWSASETVQGSSPMIETITTASTQQFKCLTCNSSNQYQYSYDCAGASNFACAEDAAAAIFHVAKQLSEPWALVEAGAIYPLVELLVTGSDIAKTLCISTLYIIAGCGKCRKELCAIGCFPPVLHLLTCGAKCSVFSVQCVLSPLHHSRHSTD